MPRPTEINLKTQSKVLTVRYDDSSEFELECELLRVYSPSAEVKGHGPGQSILQVGKEQVTVSDIIPVGNYAVRLLFDDGHDSGIYTWDYLYELGRRKQEMWQSYLQALASAGYQRKQHE